MNMVCKCSNIWCLVLHHETQSTVFVTTTQKSVQEPCHGGEWKMSVCTLCSHLEVTLVSVCYCHTSLSYEDEYRKILPTFELFEWNLYLQLAFRRHSRSSCKVLLSKNLCRQWRISSPMRNVSRRFTQMCDFEQHIRGMYQKPFSVFYS